MSTARRIIGIDPGLTRCGVGVIEVSDRRALSCVAVECVKTDPDLPVPERVGYIGDRLSSLIKRYRPTELAVEQVFAQHNVGTAMGTAYVAGVAMHAAHTNSLPVWMFTPSEVKAAVSGYGSAAKAQVGAMVQRLLGLDEIPKPADAADALAIALCAAWKTRAVTSTHSPGTAATHRSQRTERPESITPAQAAWLAAERASRSKRKPLR